MLFHRRNTGIANLHRILIGLEAVLLWVALSHSGISFTTLLPIYSYPLTIFLAALIVPVGIVLPSGAFLGGELRRSYQECANSALRQIAYICGAIFSVVVLFKDPGMSRFFLLNYIALLFPMLTLLNRSQPGRISRHFQSADKAVTTLIVGNPEAFPGLENWLIANQRMRNFHRYPSWEILKIYRKF